MGTSHRHKLTMASSSDVQFNSPSLTIIQGATGVGKSTLVQRILENRDQVYTEPIKGVLFCYSAYQELYTTMEESIPHIEFHKGVPDEAALERFAKEEGEPGHKLCILDDLQENCMDSKTVVRLACVLCHHLRISCIIVNQCAFPIGKYSRMISLQAHYFICMKNLRDKTQLNHLSRQMFPGKGSLLAQVMEDILKRDPYGYLVIDMSPHSRDSRFRLRTSIFQCQGELPQVYVPRA